MAKVVADDQSKTSTIALGAEIVGEINANGNFRIEGKVKGNIKISGRLVVTGTGVIEGDVECNTAQLAGKLDGKIKVAEILHLTSTANLRGDIQTQRIIIEEGALFTGTCKMDSVGDIKSDAK